MFPRIVITGMGTINSIGQSVESTWKGIIEGCSGVSTITAFDTTGFECRISGEVKNFVPGNYMDVKEARRMDRSCQFAVVAAQQAIDQSGLEITDQNSEQIGVIVGSGIGGINSTVDGTRTLEQKGPNRVSPFLTTMMLPDTASGQIAIRHNIKGINFCIVSACASSAHCIGEAWEIIRRGDADVVVCGGSDATINPLALAGFNNARALSRHNEEPEKASRPFDSNRDGFVPSEGAAILVIESLEHAKARGANILAEIVGYGATCDAYHVTAPPPDGSGAARAMKIALRKAGLKPEEIDYINAHGTSTPAGDLAETNAIKAVFDDYAYKVPVSSTKSELGHLLGASGAMEAIVAVETIRTGIIPPTINLEHPDPECDLDYVPNTARQMPVDVVLSNSFGFGGHNAALIFSRYVE